MRKNTEMKKENDLILYVRTRVKSEVQGKIVFGIVSTNLGKETLRI